MEEAMLRIIYVRDRDEESLSAYLCEDKSINVGDLVVCEDVYEACKVIEIELVHENELPYKKEEMKKVICRYDPEKMTNADILKLNNLTVTENYKEVEKDTIGFNITYRKDFSYADYSVDLTIRVEDEIESTPFALINELIVVNNKEEGYENLSVRIDFSSDIFSMSEIKIPTLDAKEKYKLRIPFLHIKKDAYDSITNTEVSTMTFSLLTADGDILAKEEVAFNVFPLNQPSMVGYFDRRILACYVTPEHHYVKQLTNNAAAINGGAIVSYQNIKGSRGGAPVYDYDVMINEVSSIYEAIHNWGIIYQNPPAGTELFQKLRLPGEVLQDKKGTCLDTSLLFCACLLEVGYNPILILIQGHAFVGVFLNEYNGKFSNGIEANLAKVCNLMSDPDNFAIFIETTAISLDNAVTFKEACESAKTRLLTYKENEFSAIDINTCQGMCFKPVPVDGKSIDLEQMMKPAEIKHETLDAIEEREYIDVSKEEKKDRFTFWEKKLLDLTESNPLVCKKTSPASYVRVVPLANDIYELLSNNDSLKIFLNGILPIDTILTSTLRDKIKIEVGNEILDRTQLFCLGGEKEFKNLIKKSNSAMDETGSSTLYLCLGTVNFERARKKERASAPFMILPIKITKDKMSSFYTMSYDYDDIMINQTFFEYFKENHKEVDFGNLYGINSSDNYYDIAHTFRKLCDENIVLNEDYFYIANLTFSHYIMWLDVKKRHAELSKNKIIKSILEEKSVVDEELISKDTPIDKYEKYQDFAAPLYYDSTQLKAILDCGNGKSFILDGPPGTGKSQTIVNMIVNAFYHGKTVLFVAEKKAALDVVADRLNKIQLGRFCLELHSNKANKRDFFDMLKKSMELGPTKAPEDFSKECNELNQKKDKLLNQINKMHENKYYMSLYDAIVKNEELGCYEETIDLSDDYLKSLSLEKYNKTADLIDKLIVLSENINDYQNNPLRGINLNSLNFNDKDLTISEFKELDDKLNDIIKEFDGLESDLGIKVDKNITSMTHIINACSLALNDKLYLDNINEFLANTDDSLNLKLLQIIKKLNQYELDFKAINFKTALNIDVDIHINGLSNNNGFIKNILNRMKAKKAMKSLMNEGFKVDKKELLNGFNAIHDYKKLYSYVKSNYDSLNKMIGANALNDKNEVDTIYEAYKKTREFINSIKYSSYKSTFIDNLKALLKAGMTPALKMSFSITYGVFKEFKSCFDAFNNKYKLENYLIINNKQSLGELKSLLSYGGDASSFNEMINVAALNRVSDELSKLELRDLVTNAKTNRYDIHDMIHILDLSLAKGYIRLYFMDDDINYFIPTEYEAEILKYKELINEYTNLVIAEVSAKLTKNLTHQNIDYAHSSPIGRLKKSAANGGRGVTIRDTLLNYDSIIKSYFPCFLMSPLSAAQYLAVDSDGDRSVSKFDIVIFDEASQIPTHEAVGPIARGNALIVAGDPQQMPPSAYFNAGIELEGEDVKFEDADSLLDECIAIGLPRHRLSYHYRSKHESLISFSNHNFYNDNLCTFPSPNAKSSLVEFKYVELMKAKKDTTISKEEIDAILNTIKDIYTNPKTMNKSLGIIVFNINQADTLSNKISEMLDKDKKLAKVINEAEVKTKEPYFVKSIENVQGDERDIIILSVGFKKNASGYTSVTGPLIRNNGEKRLNVAVSRSKEKMIVISTSRTSDFADDKNIKSVGALMLKRFISFAENNTFKSYEIIANDNESIVEYIKKNLESRGYTCKSNVGNSEFKVDLAIKSKTEDAYQLGILIDSKGISPTASCRDRIYVQDAVLNGLKWKIIRIYALEYFKDKNATIDKIIKALDIPFEREVHQINPNIEKKEVEEFHYDRDEYHRATRIPSVYYDNETGFSRSVYDAIEAIVSKEGPVSFETIKNRVRENSNMSVFRKKAQDRLLYCVKRCKISYSKDQLQDFYWDSNKTSISRFRVAGGRDLNDICKEEIVVAMKQVLEVQGDLNNDDLYRCTLQAFDYGQSVLSNKNKERLEYVYNWAKNNNLL